MEQFILILLGFIIYYTYSEDLRVTTFINEIPDKSINTKYTFLIYNSISMLDCIRKCSSTDSCYSVSYHPNGECKLCNRGWNTYCVICQDDPGAKLFAKDDEDKCINGGRLASDNTCMCYDGFIGSECQTVMSDCKEGISYSYYAKTAGVFYVKPSKAPRAFPVYCSLQETRVRRYVQRHYGTKRTFNQTWDSYRDGFGDMFTTAEEFWVGNLFLHYITNSGFYTLVIEMGNKDKSEVRQQDYEGFLVAEEKSYFTFTLDNNPVAPLSGLPPLGDSLSNVESGPFSTYDKEVNLYKCAYIHASGWWFGYPKSGTCGVCNPNGVIIQSGDQQRIGVDYEVFWENDMKNWSPWYVEMWLELR